MYRIDNFCASTIGKCDTKTQCGAHTSFCFGMLHRGNNIWCEACTFSEEKNTGVLCFRFIDHRADRFAKQIHQVANFVGGAVFREQGKRKSLLIAYGEWDNRCKIAVFQPDQLEAKMVRV